MVLLVVAHSIFQKDWKIQYHVNLEVLVCLPLFCALQPPLQHLYDEQIYDFRLICHQDVSITFPW